jgi:dual specificity protein kinase YAK1
MEVAVKVIKNQTAYFNQAIFEAHILKLLNHNHDPDGRLHIVRMYQYFTHADHLCIVFERLHLNLYEVLRLNSYNGLSLDLVCLITKQVRLNLRGMQEKDALFQCLHTELQSLDKQACVCPS